MKRRYRRTMTGMYPEMLRLYNEGWGYIRIAKHLNVHHATVGNYIRSIVPPSQRRPRGMPKGARNRQ